MSALADPIIQRVEKLLTYELDDMDREKQKSHLTALEVAQKALRERYYEKDWPLEQHRTINNLLKEIDRSISNLTSRIRKEWFKEMSELNEEIRQKLEEGLMQAEIDGYIRVSRELVQKRLRWWWPMEGEVMRESQKLVAQLSERRLTAPKGGGLALSPRSGQLCRSSSSSAAASSSAACGEDPKTFALDQWIREMQKASDKMESVLQETREMSETSSSSAAASSSAACEEDPQTFALDQWIREMQEASEKMESVLQETREMSEVAPLSLETKALVKRCGELLAMQFQSPQFTSCTEGATVCKKLNRQVADLLGWMAGSA